MLNKRIIFTLITLAFLSKNLYALKETTVLLDWQINPDHAPLVIAQEKGFFKKHGLNVKLVEPADPGDGPRLIAAKKADIAITYQPNYLIQVDQKLPVIAIGSLIDKPLNCISALKSQNIQQLSDLRGKKIATSNNGLSSLILKVMLSNAGIQQNEVELVHVRYNLSQALISKQVTAVNGMMRNIEIPVLESKGQDMAIFFPEDYGIPNYHELIYITHLDRQNEAGNQAFLLAIREAVQWLSTHPKDGWTLFKKRYPHTDNEMNKKAWFATMPYFTEEPQEFDPKEWGKFSQFMQDHQLISSKQSIQRYFIQS